MRVPLAAYREPAGVQNRPPRLLYAFDTKRNIF